MPSGREQRRHLDYWLDHFGEAATVADAHPSRQYQFVAALHAKGYGNGYVKRVLGSGRAALRWCYQRGELQSVPHVIAVKDSEPRERILEAEELRALWSAADEPELRRYLVLLLNTACRPEAARDLTVFQVDLARNRIDLNPPGRTQTGKRRPIIPVTAALRPWLEVQGRERLIGRGEKWLGNAWRAARESAGLTADVVPYTIRHTVATELDERNAAENEITAFMGWRFGHRMRGWYTKRRIYRPDYCGTVVAALDAWMGELGLKSETARVAARAVSDPVNLALRASSLQAKVATGGKTLGNPGAGEGIRTLDPNLGKVIAKHFCGFLDSYPAWISHANQLTGHYPALPGMGEVYRRRLTRRLREGPAWQKGRSRRSRSKHWGRPTATSSSGMIGSPVSACGASKAPGRKSFVVQWKRDGRTRQIMLGQAPMMKAEEARRKAVEVLAVVGRGEDPAASRDAAKASPTVAEWCDRWLALGVGPQGKPKRPSTLGMDRSRIDGHIRRHELGRIRLRAVSAADVRKWLADVIAGETAFDERIEGKARARRIVRGGAGVGARSLRMLKAVFAHAVRQGLIADNPARDVHAPTNAEKERERFLSPEELTRLGAAIEAAEKAGAAWQATAAIKLLLATGLRKDEAVSLRWSSIDFRAASAGPVRDQDGPQCPAALPPGPGHPHRAAGPFFEAMGFPGHEGRRPLRGPAEGVGQNPSRGRPRRRSPPRLEAHGRRHGRERGCELARGRPHAGAPQGEIDGTLRPRCS